MPLCPLSRYSFRLPRSLEPILEKVWVIISTTWMSWSSGRASSPIMPAIMPARSMLELVMDSGYSERVSSSTVWM